MQLELQNLTKQYGAKCAVDDINVVLRPGVYGLALMVQVRQH